MREENAADAVATAEARGVRKGMATLAAVVEAECRKTEARAGSAVVDAAARHHLAGRRAEAKRLREAVAALRREIGGRR